jgi:hypothetical protein
MKFTKNIIVVIIILFAYALLLVKGVDETYENAFDHLSLEYDNETFLLTIHQLDFSNNEFSMNNFVYDSYDISDSNLVDQKCNQTSCPSKIENHITRQRIYFSASRKMFWTSSTKTHVSFINATSNYQIELNTTGGIVNCLTVHNSNWTTYMNQFKIMKRADTVKLPYLKGSAEKYKKFFGNKHVRDIDEQIADMYIGIPYNSSSLNNDNDYQRHLLSSTIFISRLGREYGQVIPVGHGTMLFSPHSHYIESNHRNPISSANIFQGISSDDPRINIAAIDRHCQNADKRNIIQGVYSPTLLSWNS